MMSNIKTKMLGIAGLVLFVSIATGTASAANANGVSPKDKRGATDQTEQSIVRSPSQPERKKRTGSVAGQRTDVESIADHSAGNPNGWKRPGSSQEK